MKVSIDTSLVLAFVQGSLSADARADVEAFLGMAEEIGLSMFAFEELCRDETEFEPRRARHMAEVAMFRELASSPAPITEARATELANLWALARRRGKKSTTVDTLIARDARLARAVLLTADDDQHRYTAKAFGVEYVQYFASAQLSGPTSP